jgi:predicted dehydrogenase
MNLTFPDNILAHVHVSWLDPAKVRRTTVVGSKKMVVYNDIASNEKIRIYDKGVEVPEYTNGFGEFHFNYRHGDVLIPNVRFEEPLRKECQHFLDCILEHKTPCSDGYSGLRVIKVIEAAEDYLQNGNGQEIIEWQQQTLSA